MATYFVILNLFLNTGNTIIRISIHFFKLNWMYEKLTNYNFVHKITCIRPTNFAKLKNRWRSEGT